MSLCGVCGWQAIFMNRFMSVHSRSLLQFVFAEAIIGFDSGVFKVDLYLPTCLTPASEVTVHFPFLLDFIERGAGLVMVLPRGSAHSPYLGCMIQ